MEERDEISRHDAIMGLGAIGVLVCLLIGAIFYRIINPRPPVRRSLEGLVIAPELPTAPLAGGGVTEQDKAATVMRPDGNFAPATFDQPTPTAPPHRAAEPHFVSPGE